MAERNLTEEGLRHSGAALRGGRLPRRRSHRLSALLRVPRLVAQISDGRTPFPNRLHSALQLPFRRFSRQLSGKQLAALLFSCGRAI